MCVEMHSVLCVGCVVMSMRYSMLSQCLSSNVHVVRLNMAALVAGLTAAGGISVVGNFQVNHSFVG